MTDAVLVLRKLATVIAEAINPDCGTRFWPKLSMPRDSKVYLEDILEAIARRDIVENKLPGLEAAVRSLVHR